MLNNSGRPKYRQVADDLRQKIGQGIYRVGAELPSTSRLMTTYGVSITVVRAAIRELRAEGLVLGQPGKAVFVTAEPGAQDATEVATLHRQLGDLRASVDHAVSVVKRLDARVAELERRAGQPNTG